MDPSCLQVLIPIRRSVDVDPRLIIDNRQLYLLLFSWPRESGYPSIDQYLHFAYLGVRISVSFIEGCHWRVTCSALYSLLFFICTSDCDYTLTMPLNNNSPHSSWPVEIASSLGPPPGANIPDLTELSDVSLFLFGVPCSTKPYGRGCFNQVCCYSRSKSMTYTGTVDSCID